jgi:hypothetical protein
MEVPDDIEEQGRMAKILQAYGLSLLDYSKMFAVNNDLRYSTVQSYMFYLSHTKAETNAQLQKLSYRRHEVGSIFRHTIQILCHASCFLFIKIFTIPHLLFT